MVEKDLDIDVTTCVLDLNMRFMLFAAGFFQICISFTPSYAMLIIRLLFLLLRFLLRKLHLCLPFEINEDKNSPVQHYSVAADIYIVPQLKKNIKYVRLGRFFP